MKLLPENEDEPPTYNHVRNNAQIQGWCHYNMAKAPKVLNNDELVCFLQQMCELNHANVDAVPLDLFYGTHQWELTHSFSQQLAEWLFDFPEDGFDYDDGLLNSNMEAYVALDDSDSDK